MNPGHVIQLQPRGNDQCGPNKKAMADVSDTQSQSCEAENAFKKGMCNMTISVHLIGMSNSVMLVHSLHLKIIVTNSKFMGNVNAIRSQMQLTPT